MDTTATAAVALVAASSLRVRPGDDPAEGDDRGGDDGEPAIRGGNDSRDTADSKRTEGGNRSIENNILEGEARGELERRES